MSALTLYHHGPSSASFRVRIALEYKQLDYEPIAVDLQANAHQQAARAGGWPAPLVPTLVHEGRVLGQSLAIIEYLEELFPHPPLLPADAPGRAQARALAQMVACDIHPLNNLRVRRYLARELALDEAAQQAWYAHWGRLGLEAIEAVLARAGTHRYCCGPVPTLADCALVPQVVNLQRFGVSLDGLPTVMAVFDACMALPAFQRAHPSARVLGGA